MKRNKSQLTLIDLDNNCENHYLNRFSELINFLKPLFDELLDIETLIIPNNAKEIDGFISNYSTLPESPF